MTALRSPVDTAQVQAPPKTGFFKAGTIERLMAWRGTEDGRRLASQSKAIAVALLSRARSDRDFTCVVAEPEICDELWMDPKTFRRYLKPLVELGLISVDKNRECATRRFDVQQLYRQFGESRVPAGSKVVSLSGNLSRSEHSGKGSRSVASLRETTAPPREIATIATGNDPDAIRESGPESIKELPSSSSFSESQDVSALAARLEISNPTGMEPQIARIADAFAQWGLTERAQRRLLGQHGIPVTSNAVEYVLAQIAKHPQAAGSPGKLLDYALRLRLSLPQPQEQSRNGKLSRTDSYEGLVLDHVRSRMPRQDYDTFVRSVRLTLVGMTLEIWCPNAFVAAELRERYLEHFTAACNAAIGPNVTPMLVVDNPVAAATDETLKRARRKASLAGIDESSAAFAGLLRNETQQC
jgi:hypothetical protein